MKSLFLFEARNYFKKPLFYLSIVLMALLGFLIGSRTTISAGSDIYKNSTYTIYQLTGLMSLLSILFTTLIGAQIIFKEKDANFLLILYTTPIKKIDYLISRLLTIFLLSFFLFTVLILGLAIGHQQAPNREYFQAFTAMHYLHPLFLMGAINIFFCTTVVGIVGWLGKNKLMIYVAGLLLYIGYMAALIFSSSPMMAGALPQSRDAIYISALLDPFGISAFYHQTINWSVLQRNTVLPSLTGTFLVNRLSIVCLSFLLFLITLKNFQFSIIGRTRRKKELKEIGNQANTKLFKFIKPQFNNKYSFQSLISIVRLDLKYVIKSIPFILIALGMLFYLSMEMYAVIEKGIRLPQQYANSGLMARAIFENFHTLCLLVILFYANDLFWRSRVSRFNMIEDATPLSFSIRFLGKWLSVAVIIILFTTLMNALGIVFQYAYNYPIIEWQVYSAVYWGISFPLIISTGIILCIHHIIKNRFVSLIVATIIMLITATSLARNVGITHPLLSFQLPFSGRYSDFNKWGVYFNAFSIKMLFAAALVGLLVTLILWQSQKRKKTVFIGLTILFLSVAFLSGTFVYSNYQRIDEKAEIILKFNYEKKYRVYQQKAQPTVTHISTQVNLLPEKNSYTVNGVYRLQNKTASPINDILLNFNNNLVLKNAVWKSHQQVTKIDSLVSVIQLQQTLLPGDTAELSFALTYSWNGFNRHQSFNAIIDNGSFMRISNYYPRIGYQSDIELNDEAIRKKLGLGLATPLIKLNAPKKMVDDFIMLDMIISTPADQLAIGVGNLVKKWQEKDRNFFQYSTASPIPFRFAVSSAKYLVKTATYKGKHIEIYYHPRHNENVDHLIMNVKRTLDYCATNFAPYPYPVIRFAEISSFTRGFAATAYPSVIYMPEDMIFHANLKGDKQQDVINELAGHELSHQWWGNAQLAPDFNREGSVLLTESLAMYTELMLVKKMYGQNRLLELIAMHRDIYSAERGYVNETALIRYDGNNPALVYNKGAVVMCQLSELIGEEKVNLALKNLFQKNAYPRPTPIATDLLHELYLVADSIYHAKIKEYFTEIIIHDLKLLKTSIKKENNQYIISFETDAKKYAEDGKGNQRELPFNEKIELLVEFENGKKQLFTIANKKEVKHRILVAEKPIAISLDPFIKLMDINSIDNIFKQ